MDRNTLEQIVPLLSEVALYSMRSGELERAKVIVEGLKSAFPEDRNVGLLEGMLFFAQEKFKEAENIYKELIKKSKDFDLAKAFLAELYLFTKRFREAEKLLSEAVKSKDSAARDFAKALQEGHKKGLFTRG